MTAHLKAAIDAIKESSTTKVYEITPLAGNARSALAQMASIINRGKGETFVVVLAKR